MDTSTETSAGEQGGSLSEPRHPPLWRNLRFQTLWIGQASATLGVSVADVAYPLAILALTGSPARAGLFAAVQVAGGLAAGLPGGQLVDRHDRRTIVIVAELARALVTSLVVAGLILGLLSLPALLIAAVLLGAGGSVASAARLPLVRSVVPADQLTTALIQDEVRMNGAALAGPPLGGALYAIRALAHAVPFIFTAAAFALSVLSAIAMKFVPSGADSAAATPEQAGASAGASAGAASSAAARSGDTSMLAGMRTLWRSPVLRAAALLIMTVNAVLSGLDLVIIVFLRDQHVHAGLIGTVLAAAAVGGLAGAPLVKPLHHIRPGILLLSGCLLLVPIVAGLALPLGPWWMAVLLFVASLSMPALRVLVDVLIFRQTPDEQRGRIVAAVMTLFGLGIPAGMAGTGLLLQWLPAQAAMLTMAALLAVGVLYCATMRPLWSAQWPAAARAR